MKITCERSQLQSAFAVAASVAPQRSPKPILQNVKIEATSQGVVLTATDQEVGVRVEVPNVEIEMPGSALLPVDRVGLILRESADTKLRFNATEKGTTVKGDRSEFKLPGGNPDEFPPLVATREERCHVVSVRLFRELVRRTMFATDTESSRYALAGVLLEFDNESITAVGTDGRRLAKMAGPATSIGDHRSGDTTTIVPTRAMQLMERAFTDVDGEVRLTTRGNDIVAQSTRVSVVARLVEGRFPRWRDVFPDRTDAVKIEFAVGPLHAAIRQAAVVASQDSRGIDFTFGDGSLVLSGSTANLGQSRVEMPIAYTGTPITITLDHRFVSDFLKVLDPERTFTLEIENGEGAALFQTDDGYGYIVMPLARDQ
ncbi:MAG TPA: DNA polymerase III subunit beta [Pirellulaceae bacterium]|nr:DNA polymerase III subunit beta [Pirellulaceae bacterium]